MQLRTSPFTIASTLFVLAAIAAGVVAALRIDRRGETGSGLSDRFDYDLAAYKKIAPELIGYRETAGIELELVRPTALAVGPDDVIYIAAERCVACYQADGTPVINIALDETPQCVTAVEAEQAGERLYVGMREHVELYERGKRVAAWPPFGEKAVVTAIAVAAPDVFVADAGNRIVWRCDTSGSVVARIGERDEDRGIRGFFIPSPYFDLAVAPDGLLRVVNPAAHRIEAYTFDGDLELHWGKASLAVEGFSGCCNPANIAMLPDGRIVTAEKGLPRVKVYDSEGNFTCAVAGPDAFAIQPSLIEETRPEHRLDVLDVAIDSRQRILVLDPAARRVRVFERISEDDRNRRNREADGIENVGGATS
jgi:hypothetical protein